MNQNHTFKNELEKAEMFRLKEIFYQIKLNVFEKKGSGFFASFTEEISKVLDVRYAFVGEYIEGGKVETLAMCVDGKLTSKYEYRIENTPCDHVIHKQLCCFPSNVQGNFPLDQELRDLSVESYIGTPLFDSQNQVIGLLVIMDIKPLKEVEITTRILQVFASRAAIELEHHQKSRALKESEERYRNIVEHSPDAIAIIQNNHYSYINPAGAKLLGARDPKFINGYHMQEFLSKESYVELQHYISDIKRSMQKVINFHAKKMKLDGSPVFLEIKGTQVRYNGKQAVQLVMRDISKRIQDESELRETKEQLESLFMNSYDAIVIYDKKGKIINVNQSFEEVFDLAKQEVIGKDISIITRNRNEKRTLKTIFLKRDDAHSVNEFAIHRRNNATLYLGVTVSELTDTHGKTVAFSAIIRDLTKAKESEEMSIQSEKMKVVGQMAAGIAHEIRNPLTSIMGFIHLMNERQELRKSYLQIMKSELERINFIVNELLVLAKPQAIQYSWKDIVTTINHVVSLISTQAIMNNVQIMISDIPHRLPAIYCDENQIKQVFINVIKNSIEAMPNGGKIVISIDLTACHYIHIKIEDEGTGISKNILNHLGNPFYTTKEKGTGLGLTISYKIIKEHNGQITINNRKNKGTVIEIFLPTQHRHNASNDQHPQLTEINSSAANEPYSMQSSNSKSESQFPYAGEHIF